MGRRGHVTGVVVQDEGQGGGEGEMTSLVFALALALCTPGFVALRYRRTSAPRFVAQRFCRAAKWRAKVEARAADGDYSLKPMLAGFRCGTPPRNTSRFLKDSIVLGA